MLAQTNLYGFSKLETVITYNLFKLGVILLRRQLDKWEDSWFPPPSPPPKSCEIQAPFTKHRVPKINKPTTNLWRLLFLDVHAPSLCLTSFYSSLLISRYRYIFSSFFFFSHNNNSCLD